MNKILNIWRSTDTRTELYNEGEPIQVVGDYKVYCRFGDNYLYTYKNIAITELAGHNKELPQLLSEDIIPEEHSPNYFIFNRARANVTTGLALAKRIKFEVQ